MTVSRASALSGALGRTVFRRSSPSLRARPARQLGRRTYASGHGGQKSSELPWMVGSIVFTVPAAAWLIAQGPTKGEHGHAGHGEDHASEAKDVEETPEEEPAEKEEDESETEPKENDAKDSAEPEAKDEADGDDKKDEDAGDSEGDKSDDGMKKGPGEGQKGERKPTEKKSEKMAAGDKSGAKHPYLDDAEKSKKGLGVTETAKIHGTVDPKAGARGIGATGDSANSEEKSDEEE